MVLMTFNTMDWNFTRTRWKVQLSKGILDILSSSRKTSDCRLIFVDTKKLPSQSMKLKNRTKERAESHHRYHQE